MRRAFVLFGASLALGAALPLVLPVGRPAQRLRVASENSCLGAARVPAHIAPLPHFSRAVGEEGRVRIVAIGSSSTEGVGASSPAENYPSQLREMLAKALPAEAIEVVNLGVGGETAAETAARLREEIPRLHPDLVLWQVGANDGITGVPPEKYEATLRDALDFLKKTDTDVVLVGMQWTRRLAALPNYLPIRDVTARVARDAGVALVSRYDAMRQYGGAAGREEFTGPDHLHLNDKGYRCLAEQIAVTLSHAIDDNVISRVSSAQRLDRNPARSKPLD
ncbi:GDSL-type esterase/lipase family protein [Rhodoblastus sp.]|uniref:SGNH/GDSL hydrolase family protein n=1 Tax=Rhodoblastus sp. TaxID=1962975 RepID=UPI00262E51BA|nr:GDSL-type esterase/lipase family protein [Rhodoblastus sp.]